MRRTTYTLLLWLMLPYVFIHLLSRARRQPAYLHHIAERFGAYPTYGDKPVIWLHTVSVGETRAAASLVKRLQQTYPDHQLLLTHTTPTGRETSEQLYGNSVQRVYLPYDYPFAVRRFIRHFKPRIGILLETEIWPNLIHACKAADVPLLLLNARMSEKSARRYARYPDLFRSALVGLAAVAAQSEADASRLAALGARDVSVMGNLKFDIEPPAGQIELGMHLRHLFGADRKVFLAGSTRDGEEALVLDALSRARIPGLLTVIVPRHPQRFDEVAALIEKHGLQFMRRSANRPVAADVQVVLGDSMGEMFAYYKACDIALIGGSLLPYGGQNLIEPCAVGKPVLVGPHTYNFAQASELAVSAGAAQRIASVDELGEHLQHLFAEPAEMAAMSETGKKFVAAHQGATEAASKVIRAFLPAQR